MTPEQRSAYWRANLRLVAACLVVWFVCSYGFGILLVEELNRIRPGGFKLGFWFAQQGSIYVFAAAIAVSYLTAPPPARIQGLVERIRVPRATQEQ